MSRLDRVLLSTAEAAEQVGVEPATLRDWTRRGLLQPAGGTARRPLWRASAVLAASRSPKPRRADRPHGRIDLMERRVTDAEKALMDRIAERAGVPLGEVTNISADHSDGGDWRITVERAPITLHLNRDEWSALQEG